MPLLITAAFCDVGITFRFYMKVKLSLLVKCDFMKKELQSMFRYLSPLTKHGY